MPLRSGQVTSISFDSVSRTKSRHFVICKWIFFTQVNSRLYSLVMRRFLLLSLSMLLFFSCEKILEVQRFDGPCTIELVNGQRITTQNSIEILESTGTITYRDEEGKLWSIKSSEYTSYSCGN